MTETVTINGRVYVLKKSGAGSQMRVRRILSKEPGLSTDEAYLSLCVIFESVDSIDGVPVPRANNPEQFEATANKVSDDLEELAVHFKRMNGGAPEIETAKNS